MTEQDIITVREIETYLHVPKKEEIRNMVHDEHSQNSNSRMKSENPIDFEKWWQQVKHTLQQPVSVQGLIQKIKNFLDAGETAEAEPYEKFVIPFTAEYQPLGNTREELENYFQNALDSQNLKELQDFLKHYQEIQLFQDCSQYLNFFIQQLEKEFKLFQKKRPQSQTAEEAARQVSIAFCRYLFKMLDPLYENLKRDAENQMFADLLEKLNAYLYEDLHVYTMKRLPRINQKLGDEEDEDGYTDWDYFDPVGIPTSRTELRNTLSEICRLPYVIDYLNSRNRQEILVMPGRCFIYRV